jgi:hypothetical protein
MVGKFGGAVVSDRLLQTTFEVLLQLMGMGMVFFENFNCKSNLQGNKPT